MLSLNRREAIDCGSWIGRSIARVEDGRLLAGRGTFIDDLAPQDCLHLVFLRSPRARGIVRQLDLSDARAAPGVVAAFSGDDLGALGDAAVNPLLPGMRIPRFRLLATDRVYAVGQPVAAIVATSALDAVHAAGLVKLSFDHAPEEPGLQEEVVSHAWSTGDVEGLFQTAHRIVQVKVQHARLAPSAIEPRAALGTWNNDERLLTVWLATQTPHRARTDLAGILGLDAEQIRVIAPDVGGAFGGKASIYPEDAMVAWAAWNLRRPVKWCSTRSDDLAAATHGRGGTTEGELAVNSAGRMIALRARLEFPLGHWLPFSAVVPGRNAGRILPGPYRVEAVDVRLSGKLTNTASVGIYRGAGRPEAAMLMERLADKAACALDLDPAEFRRRNLLAPEALPYRTPTGETLDSGDYPALLAKACQRAGYDTLRREQRARRERGEICGVGLSIYTEPCGEGWESATVSLTVDGALMVATGSSAQGQGRETAFAQIAADVLGVPPDRISVRHGDTATTPAGIGALASRSTAIGGSAVLRAAESLRHMACREAAGILGCSATGLATDGDGLTSLGDPNRMLSWRELAAHCLASDRQGTDGHALSASEVFRASGEAWSSGCCVAQVSVDLETGVPRVERITMVDDIGVVVNPMLVEGQLHGGMAQGLGEALMEKIVYDTDGQLLTGSLLDYALPRAADIPAVVSDRLSTPSPFNALGAKGVGEAGCVGVPAAIVNAVVDALSPFGITQIDMPITGETIWRAMRSGPSMAEE